MVEDAILKYAEARLGREVYVDSIKRLMLGEQAGEDQRRWQTYPKG